MTLKRLIKKTFNKGNVCVTGLRGTGKDVLFGNVIARRKLPYLSNLDYGGSYNKLDFDYMKLGGNTYDTMINNPLHYEWQFPYETDIYISDVGVYFPAQYCNELNRKYQSLPYFLALSRQVAHNNVHINVQNLNRAWDKLREQSDIYITCNWCKVIFGFVIQKITVYSKYQSCIDRVPPCRIKLPWLNKDRIQKAEIEIEHYKINYGDVSSHILIYRNKSKHDTYYFEKLLKEGVKNEK